MAAISPSLSSVKSETPVSAFDEERIHPLERKKPSTSRVSLSLIEGRLSAIASTYVILLDRDVRRFAQLNSIISTRAITVASIAGIIIAGVCTGIPCLFDNSTEGTKGFLFTAGTYIVTGLGTFVTGYWYEGKKTQAGIDKENYCDSLENQSIREAEMMINAFNSDIVALEALMNNKKIEALDLKELEPTYFDAEATTKQALEKCKSRIQRSALDIWVNYERVLRNLESHRITRKVAADIADPIFGALSIILGKKEVTIKSRTYLSEYSDRVLANRMKELIAIIKANRAKRPRLEQPKASVPTSKRAMRRARPTPISIKRAPSHPVTEKKGDPVKAPTSSSSTESTSSTGVGAGRTAPSPSASEPGLSRRVSMIPAKSPGPIGPGEVVPTFVADVPSGVLEGRRTSEQHSSPKSPAASPGISRATSSGKAAGAGGRPPSPSPGKRVAGRI